MKKFFSAILVCVLFLGSMGNTRAISESSNGSSVYMDAAAKQQFAASVDLEMKGFTYDASRNDMVDQLLLKIPIADADEKVILIQELEALGIFEFQCNSINSPSTRSSDSADVYLKAPQVFYDGITKNWTVTCGGNWLNNDWNKDALFYGDLGGADAFGVGYTQVGSNYTTRVVSASAQLWDQDSNQSVTTHNRSDGDGSLGYGFQLQDYTYSPDLSTSKYVGYKWSGYCTYDANFDFYSGIATGYYVHTYSTASVSSVNFGVQGKVAGVDVTLNNAAQSFKAYSRDTRFG